MPSIIASVIPYKVLFAQILLVGLFLALIFKRDATARLIGRYATLLAFLVSLVAVSGSLFYSEVMGFEPCVLCWWIRVFIFPLSIIFGLALWKRNKSGFLYAVPLAIVAGLISLYYAYVSVGGASLLPCTAAGGACSRVYVLAFGFLTIPAMSLTVALYILALAWTNKIYKNADRHS